MGTFVGHALPGAVIAFLALWHCVKIIQLYFRKDKRHFSSNTYFVSGLLGLKRQLPWESVIKVLAAIIHATLEITTGFSKGIFVYYGNIQHISMVLFFGIQGLVEILDHNKITLPPSCQYMTLSLAFIFEGFAFTQHLHMRPIVDVQMHIVLVLLAMGSALLIAIEMNNRSSLSLALAARYVIMLQGTWLIEMGFILYPPSSMFHSSWSLDDHKYNELISATFGFLAAFLVVFMLAIWLVFAVRNKELKGYNVVDEKSAEHAYKMLLQDEEEL